MHALINRDDPYLEEALESWDEARESGGPEAGEAFLRSLPDEFRALVEYQIRRRLAVEDALQAADETDDEPTEDECGARGVRGRYENLGVHAIGGMGVVYRARDAELDRVVAYKVMKTRYRDDPEGVRRFQQEALVTSRLQHPGIVPVLGFVDDESGPPAYAMEFVEGDTLANAIKEFHAADSTASADAGARSLNELIRHFIAACQVVAYAHDRSYVHGDLKPLNILIDQYGATRVLDWGVSRYVIPDGGAPDVVANAEADAISRRIVSRGFHGPSVDQVGVPASFASDIYALGATLQSLLTGRPPSAEPDSRNRSTGRVPQALAAVYRKAMDPDPTRRYPNPAALAHDVQRFLDDEPNSVYRDPFITRVRRSVRRHRLIAVAGVLTFLFACAAITVGTIAKSSFERSAQRDQARIRFESGRAPIESFISVEALKYMANDKELAAEAYNRIVRQAEMRMDSEFVTDADRILLARCYFARGIVEMPGEYTKGKDSAPFRESVVKSFLAAVRSNGPLKALKNVFDREPNTRAEVWLDKSVRSYDALKQPEKLLTRDRDAMLASIVERAAVRFQIGRCTEALMDWERALHLGEGVLGSSWGWLRPVIRMQAEEEQANLMLSRPSSALDPKTMRLAAYLADYDGVSDAAVYNAACVFSVASLDHQATAAERDSRATRAVTYLSRITERGYFRGKKQSDELQRDHDLDPLRSRSDFQSLRSNVRPVP
jgi:serine/threonine protein kinase